MSMEAIFSTIDDESRQKKCIELMKEKFQEIKNIETEYEIITTLNGGKSGALIQKVRHRKTSNEVVLKTYKTEKYNPRDLDTNTVSRPVREIYTTCVMSGTEGFPTVYDFGIDENNYLYLISELVSGEPMNRVDMSIFSSEQKAAILLQILNLLYVAKHKLGKFIHNDLHPGNIFIDTSKFYTSKINFGTLDTRKFKEPHPKVTIIDFDLSVSKRYSRDPNPRMGLTIPLSVIEWISNIFNVQSVYKILLKSFIGQTEDLKIWNVYYIGLSMLQFGQSHSTITEDDINKLIDDAIMCDTLETCLTHPYINDNMNDTRTQYRDGEPEFTPPSISDERKEIEKQINLIIDTMLKPLGLEGIGNSFMESYANLNEIYFDHYKTNLPYEKVILSVLFFVVPIKTQILKIDSCLTGSLGNLNVHVILPDKVIIKLFLKDKKIEIEFISSGLTITNVTHRYRFLAPVERIISGFFLYFANPIIFDLNIRSSEHHIGSTDFTINFVARKIGRSKYETVIPPNADIDFKQQIENIMRCVIPTLFKNKDIFEPTVLYQAMTQEENGIILLGNPVEQDWTELIEKINKKIAKNLLSGIFG